MVLWIELVCGMTDLQLPAVSARVVNRACLPYRQAKLSPRGPSTRAHLPQPAEDLQQVCNRWSLCETVIKISFSIPDLQGRTRGEPKLGRKHIRGRLFDLIYGLEIFSNCCATAVPKRRTSHSKSFYR
jgi:hypothetical protein